MHLTSFPPKRRGSNIIFPDSVFHFLSSEKEAIVHVLALTVGGVPWRWLEVEDAAYYLASDKVAWHLGDPAAVLHGGIQRHSGCVSRLEVPPIIALANSEALSRHTGPIALGREDNHLLARRDRWICGLCGEKILPRDMTRDHVIPRSRGGRDVWANVVSAHRSCNSRKGARTPEEAGMPLVYVPYTPCREESFLLAGRNILGDQLDFLAARLPAHSRALAS